MNFVTSGVFFEELMILKSNVAKRKVRCSESGIRKDDENW